MARSEGINEDTSKYIVHDRRKMHLTSLKFLPTVYCTYGFVREHSQNNDGQIATKVLVATIVGAGSRKKCCEVTFANAAEWHLRLTVAWLRNRQ
jgi:hypothetical protein